MVAYCWSYHCFWYNKHDGIMTTKADPRRYWCTSSMLSQPWGWLGVPLVDPDFSLEICGGAANRWWEAARTVPSPQKSGLPCRNGCHYQIYRFHMVKTVMIRAFVSFSIAVYWSRVPTNRISWELSNDHLWAKMCDRRPSRNFRSPNTRTIICKHLTISINHH